MAGTRVQPLPRAVPPPEPVSLPCVRNAVPSPLKEQQQQHKNAHSKMRKRSGGTRGHVVAPWYTQFRKKCTPRPGPPEKAPTAKNRRAGPHHTRKRDTEGRMSNSMRELGGLVDNLYISSQQKNRHPQDLPGMMASKNREDATSTPSRARKMKVWLRAKTLGAGRGRGGLGVGRYSGGKFRRRRGGEDDSCRPCLGSYVGLEERRSSTHTKQALILLFHAKTRGCIPRPL